MARGRFLNTSIADDIELNNLSMEAHWLYMMTIPHLDRDGLIKADTYVLFGKVCPRRPEIIPRIDALLAEWAKAGIVILYQTREGRIAFFRGFHKNQQGMHYAREAASQLEPPPGYVRTAAGIEPVQDSSKPTPDELPTKSGLNPAEAEDQDQLEDQDQAEAEDAAPPATAAVDPDVARVWEAWNSNMPGLRSPVITDGVNALLGEYSATEIVEAIAIACRRHKRSLGYIQGILQKGVFSESPKHSGGDYRPARAANRGRNAATAYMERKGMINGRN